MRVFLILGFSFILFVLKGQSNFFKSYSGLIATEPASLVQLPDSGYIIYSTEIGGGDNQELRRLDKTGNVIWHKQLLIALTTERAGAITLTQGKQILISGIYNGSINLFRLDLNGNIIFRKVYSGSGGPSKIVEGLNGDINIIAGPHLIRTDSLGNLKWKKNYMSMNKINSLINLPGKRSVLVGSANLMVGPSSISDIVEVFIDSTGTPSTQKGFGSNAWEIVYDAFPVSNSRIMILFDTDNYSEKEHAFGLMCTDTSGKQLWTKLVYGDFAQSMGVALLKDNSIICYSSEASGPDYLLHMFHFLSDGKAIEHTMIPTVAGFFSYYSPIGAASDGGYFIMGRKNTGDYGLLKVDASLKPFCKSTAIANIREKSVLLDELQYYSPAQTISSSTSNSTFSFTPGTSTITASCSSTCSTVASFSASVGSICVNNSILFTNNSQNFSSNSWEVNGNIVGSGTNLNHFFTNPGSHTITLIVNGACIDSMKQIVFIDSVPNPNFSWTLNQLKVRFRSAAFKSGVFLSWNFGDGTPVNSSYDSIYHNYKAAGIYTVCLTQTNTCGSVNACKMLNLNFNYTNSFYRAYYAQIGATVVQFSDGTYFASGEGSGQTGIINRLDSAGKAGKAGLLNFGASSQQYIENMTANYEGGVVFSGIGISNPLHIFGRADSTCSIYYVRSFAVGVSDKLGNNIELKDGSMLFCGGAFSQGYIMGLRKNFSLQFYKSYNAFRNIVSVQRSPAGNYYAFGNDFPNSDLVLMKLDSSYNVIWIKKYDFGSTQCFAGDMQISQSGKIYMTGNSASSNPGVLLFATDSAGNSLWSTVYYNILASHYGRSIVIDKKGMLNISSNSSPIAAGTGAIIKTDTLGNFISAWTPNISNYKIFATHDKGLAIAGTCQTCTATSSALIKLDSTNALSCFGTSLTMLQSAVTPTISPLSTAIATTAPIFNTFFVPTTTSQTDTLFCASSIVTDVSKFIDKESNFLNVFPNPATNFTNVTLEKEKVMNIQLLNSLGQILLNKRDPEAEWVVDISVYAPGIYFVCARNKDGTTVSKKIIKH
jgi:PKD repeat protein